MQFTPSVTKRLESWSSDRNRQDGKKADGRRSHPIRPIPYCCDGLRSQTSERRNGLFPLTVDYRDNF